MVVCKCRKATKLYCFVHEAPVCGECICFPEHKICVVRSYSEWVIDGEYDWPPKCCMCHSIIEEGTDPQTTRLGCLHIIHTNCLVSHIKGFPPHTAPAGYTCPACSTPIWPPKNFKDSGSQIHSKLKEAIIQSGMEKNFFGNNPVSLPTMDPRGPPPAFSSDPLVYVPVNGVGQSSGKDAALYPISTAMASDDIVEIDGPSSSNFVKSTSPVGPGATTRKNTFPIDRQNSEMSYYADDEDGNQKKYTRRGGLRHKLLRALLPFWSSALPTLPVTAPPRKDGSNAADDAPEGRVRHQKSSRMDPRKILLTIAIMACVATMGILYYRLAQGVLGDEDMHGDEQ